MSEHRTPQHRDEHAPRTVENALTPEHIQTIKQNRTEQLTKTDTTSTTPQTQQEPFSDE